MSLEAIEEDLEETQDWKLLGLHQDVIPKRGEKDFEPDGTLVQSALLDDARSAMYLALGVTRGHTLKQLLNAVWFPEFGKAYVPHLKGPYFKDVGEPVLGSNKRVNQAAWLNPIETIYLCERGTLRVFLCNDLYRAYIEELEQESEVDEEATAQKEFDFDMCLISLSLSHLYSMASANDAALIPKYQVYSYLKRLGYLILPFKDNTETQKQSFVMLLLKTKHPCWGVRSLFDGAICGLANFFSYIFPRRSNLLPLKHFFSYLQIFESIRLVQSYSTYDSLKALPLEDQPKLVPSFDVWKPTPQFSKKAPPAPDFQIVILDTNEESFPTLPQIQHLLNSASHDFFGGVGENKPAPKQKKTSSSFPTKKDIKAQKIKERQLRLDPEIQRRLEYTRLRDNKFKFGASGRCFVVALFDNGVVNFINLSEGDFRLATHGTQDISRISSAGIKEHGMVWQ